MTEGQNKANNYLMEIRNAEKEINEMILKIDYLRYKASGATAIRYDKDHVQTSPGDMVCEAIVEAVSIENKLFAKHKRLVDMRERTHEICQLWGDNCSKLIETYYLSRGSMGDVAKVIGCSDRSAYRIKLDALERFSKHL